MGLNFSAALERLSQGIGQIAQVRYQNLMRQEESANEERRSAVAFARQQALAEFTAAKQLDMQTAGFEHSQKMTEAGFTHDDARLKLQLEQQREIADRQYKLSASEAASSNAYRQAQLQAVKDAADLAKSDRTLQESLRPFNLMRESAAAQITAINKAYKDEPMMDETRRQALQQTYASAQAQLQEATDATIKAMLPTMHLEQGTLDSVNKMLEANPSISVSEALMNSLRPTKADAAGAAGAAGQPGATSAGGAGAPQKSGNRDFMSNLGDDAASMGPDVMGAIAGAAFPAAGPIIKGARMLADRGTQEDATSAVADKVGQIAGMVGAEPSLGQFDLQPSQPSGEMNPAVALRRLSAPAQMEIKSGKLSERSRMEIKQLGFDPDEFLMRVNPAMRSG